MFHRRGFVVSALLLISAFFPSPGRAAEGDPAPARILIVDLNSISDGFYLGYVRWPDVTDAWIKGFGVRESSTCIDAEYCDRITQLSVIPRRSGLNGEIIYDKDAAGLPIPGVDHSDVGRGPHPVFSRLVVEHASHAPDVLILIAKEGQECLGDQEPACELLGRLSSRAFQQLAEKGVNDAFFLHPRLVILVSPEQLPSGSKDQVLDPDSVLADVVSGHLPAASTADRLEAALRNLSRRQEAAVWSDIFPNAAILGFDGKGPEDAEESALRSLSNSTGARLSGLAFALAAEEQRSAPGNTSYFQQIAKSWEEGFPGAVTVLPARDQLKTSISRRGAVDPAVRERVLLDVLDILSDHRLAPWTAALPMARRASLFGKAAHLAIWNNRTQGRETDASGYRDFIETFVRLVDLYALPGFDEAAEAALEAENSAEIDPIDFPEAVAAVQKLLSSQSMVPLRFGLRMVASWASDHPELVDPLYPLLNDGRVEIRKAVLDIFGQVLRDVGYSSKDADADVRMKKAIELVPHLAGAFGDASEVVRTSAITNLARIVERHERDEAVNPDDPYLAPAGKAICEVAPDALRKLPRSDEALAAASSLIVEFGCPPDAAAFGVAFDLMKSVKDAKTSQSPDEFCGNRDRAFLAAARAADQYAGADAVLRGSVRAWIAESAWKSEHDCDRVEIESLFADKSKADPQ